MYYRICIAAAVIITINPFKTKPFGAKVIGVLVAMFLPQIIDHLLH